MSLSFTGANGTTSATIPSHAAGDLIICRAYRDGSTTAPTIPSGQGWSAAIDSSGANTNCQVVVAKVAAGSSEATGTFTNASRLEVIVVKTSVSGGSIGYKGGAAGGASSTTLSFTGFTLDDPTSSSRIIAFAGHRSVNTTTDSAPTGFTNITTSVDATCEVAAHASTSIVSSFSTLTQSVGGTSSGWRTFTMEVWEIPPLESLKVDDTTGTFDLTFPSLPSANYITVGYWQKNEATVEATPYGRSNKVTLDITTNTGSAFWIVGNGSNDGTTVMYNDNAMVGEDATGAPDSYVGDIAFFNHAGYTEAEIEGWIYHTHTYIYDSTNSKYLYGSWIRLESDSTVRENAFDAWSAQELRDFASNVSEPHPSSSGSDGGLSTTLTDTMVFDGEITSVKPFNASGGGTRAVPEDFINYYKNLSVFVSSTPPSKGDILAWSMATKDAPPSGAWGFYPLVNGGSATYNDFSGNARHLTNSSTATLTVASIAPAPVSVDTSAPSLSTLSASATSSSAWGGTVTVAESGGTLYKLVTTDGSHPDWEIEYLGITQAVATTGSIAISGSGLASSTLYYLQIMYVDASGNWSTSLSTSFTTDAGASGEVLISANTTADYTGFDAIHTREANSSDNYWDNGNADRGIEIQSYDSGDRSHGYLYPTGLSNLTGETLSDFSVELYLDNVSGTTSLSLRRLLVSSDKTQVTWDERSTGVNWTNGGSLGNGTDREATSLVDLAIVSGDIGTYIIFSSSALTAWANGVLAGTITNYGLELEMTSDTAYDGRYAFLNNQTFTDGTRPIARATIAGGGATNLTVNDASNAHSADNVVLTSSTAISVNDASHAHTTDNVTLSTGITLTVSDSTHGHTVDNVTLTSQTGITVADATHAHTVDNLVLVSNTGLTVADSSHGHSADNVTLTSDMALVVADALHDHAADNITLNTANVADLIVADSSHGHTVDNLVLTSNTWLSIADATHSHSVDSVALTLDTVLSVNDALNAHSADNVVLELAGIANLVIQDATHSHTADNLVLTSNTDISVNDAAHVHSADNITLNTSDATNLTVADSSHAHAIDNIDFTLDYYLSVADASHSQLADSVVLGTQQYLTVSDCLHELLGENCNVSILPFRQYPLAGLTQARPITDIQQYPLAGQVQTRPLG